MSHFPWLFASIDLMLRQMLRLGRTWQRAFLIMKGTG